jgi:hypothetical protein
MRRDSLLLLGLLSTICMIGGVVGGIQTGNIVIGPPQASPTAPRGSLLSPTAGAATPIPAPNLQPTALTRQMALLVIGLSDKNAAQPKFEGAWIIAFSPGINKYYVLGFPPEAHFRVNGLGPDQPLADIYAEGVQQDLGYLFVRDAIQSVFTGMSVQAVVTLDRSDLANLTTNLGGISVGSQLLVGVSLAAAFDTESLNGPAARMDFEGQTIQALFQDLAAQHWTPDSVAVYLQQLPQAVRPGDAVALTDLAHSAPSLQNSELIWTVAGGIHGAATVP